MNRREQWDRWGWAVVGIGLVVVFAVMIFGRDAFCDAGEQCTREWVSALGAWAAVPAAVVTVAMLSKQMRASERHHRELMLLETEYKYELADVLTLQTQNANSHIDDVLAAAIQQDATLFESVYEDIFNRLRSTYLNADAWDEFEKLFVFDTVYTVEELRAAITEVEGEPIVPSTLFEFKDSKFEETLHLIRTYNEAVNRSASRYKRRIDALVFAAK